MQLVSVKITTPDTIGVVIQPAATGPPGVGANWRGAWSGATTYALGDGVQGSNGHNYISLVGSNLNHNPTSTSGFWSDLIPTSVVNVGTTAPGSGSTGDQYHARSDGTVSRFTPPRVSVDAFGATGDGLTDDTAAIQAAINSLPQTGNSYTSGGTIAFTRSKTYLITSTLLCDALIGVVLAGPSQTHGGSRILASGALASSANAMISARSTKSFKISDGLVIENTNSAYAGIMVDLSTRPADVNTNNTDRAHIAHTSIYMQPAAGSTAIGVSLQNAQACTIERAWITGGGVGVRGMITNADFATVMTIEKCYFQNQDTIAIRNLGFPGNVEKNVFEPLRNGNAGAYLQDAAVPANGLSFRGNYTGDVQNGAAGTWFTVNGSGIVFSGGGFVTSQSVRACTGIATNANTDGLDVGGALFNNLLYGLDPTTGTNGKFRVLGNSYVNVTTQVRTNNFGQGSEVEGAAVPKAALTITASGWANTGGGFAPLSYWLDSAGYVHLEGYVTPQAGYAANTTMATLPAGYRPGYQLRQLAYGNSAGTPAACGITITTLGAIIVVTTGMGNIAFENVPPFAQVN